MNKTIYISGPISGVPGLNKDGFARAEERLKRKGFNVVNPHTVSSHLPEGTEWEDYMRCDLKAMLDCDGIYLLMGWQQSRGARLERGLAIDLKFDVMHETRGEVWE